jgi:hypothetical protein
MKYKKIPLSVGPFLLVLSIFALIYDDAPPSDVNKLVVVSGTVLDFHESNYKFGSSKLIDVVTDDNVSTLKVFSDKNNIKVGEEIVAKVESGWQADIAWELEQNNKLIYSFDEIAPHYRKMDNFSKPLAILAFIFGVLISPFWLISLFKKP